ncbi:hypothetical protein XI25_06235 [Paenibacillus sp. DMB20]|nr:hypothetical protein XI25_06235 [Paenibacillus sp. DMB20]
MSNMHRIHWFDQQIREGKYPNSSILSQQFEISRRQAQRDIEYMETTLLAPLTYIAKHRGYCYEDKTYVLPLLYMTDEEKKVLAYLIHRYRNFDHENSSSVRRIANLLERFTDEQISEQTRLPVFHVHARTLQYFELLTYAIRESHVVDLTYTEDQGEKTLTVYPLRLDTKYNADYVHAFCPEYEREIDLRLDRIGQLNVRQEKFRISHLLHGGHVGEKASLRPKPFQARLKLREPLTETAWHGFPARAEGATVYTMDFFDIEMFLYALYAHSKEWEEILKPQWLVVKLRKRCETLLIKLEPEPHASGGPHEDGR